MTVTTDQDLNGYDEMKDETEHFEWLSVTELLDDPDNLREEYDGIEELAASIKMHGLKQPITCHRDADGRYMIEAGHRRKRALIVAGVMKTRVIVSHRVPLPEERIATMLIENGNRKDLNPMEQAFGLERIRNDLQKKREDGAEGNTHVRRVSDMDVANYIGRSQVWVSDRIKLLSLDPDQQQAVREGRMTIGEGKRIGRVNSGAHRPNAIGKTSAGYFVTSHDLGDKAAKRCKALGHKAGGPNFVAIACGKCWEHCIRQDEREKNQRQAIANGHCGICGNAVEDEPKDG